MSRVILLALVAIISNGCSQKLILTGSKPRTTHEAFAKNYMIATQGVHASKAAERMFSLGGNAFDAAAAVSFVISVERPQSTGIGGGGFMVIRTAKDQKIVAVDFREKAPLKAHERMYLDKKGNVIGRKSLDGPLSAGVPGLVAGVLEIHQKYGKLSRQQVVQPAVELATKGFKVYPHLARAIERRIDVIRKYPASAKVFLKKDGSPLKVGDLIVQKDLARTLQAIYDKGKDGFYKGWVARAIASSQRKHGGWITAKDLNHYEVKWRKPVRGTYKGYEIVSMPPPSSGGTHVIQILNILEKDPLGTWGPFDPRSIHLTASAMQRAFADRATYLGDTDFVKVPLGGLISKPYASSLRASISNERASRGHEVKAGNPPPIPYESPETTHFTIMDREGNVATSTQTINYLLGSGQVVAGTGIVLNDEMDDFSIKRGIANVYGAVGGTKNAIQAGKRPLSSMSPTIVLKDGKPVLALGTPSGTRIITCVTLTILNYLEHKLSLYDSVAAIRYHQQWTPDQIRVDDPSFSKSTISRLEKMGHAVEAKNLGCKVNAISREGELLHGVADPRGEGLAIGG